MNFNFALRNVDNTIMSLEDYTDAKGFIIVFTCNHCPYAIAYEERLKELDQKYTQKGYPLIAINPNDPNQYPLDSFENMKVRAEDKQFQFPYLFDETQEIAQNYGAERTPHAFVLTKKGVDLSLVYKGAIDDNYQKPNEVKEKYIEEVIDQLLAEKQLDIQETIPVGCSVKWKPENI